MGTLRLRCNHCKEMEHWSNDVDLPGTWAYRTQDKGYKVKTIRTYPEYKNQEPENLFCSVDCFRKYHNDI